MFNEQWQLDTQPILNGGAAIRVLLKGLATQDDLNAEKRAALEKELNQRQTAQIVQSILNEILDCVRSPERPASPVDAYVTVSSYGLNKICQRSGRYDNLSIIINCVDLKEYAKLRTGPLCLERVLLN